MTKRKTSGTIAAVFAILTCLQVSNAEAVCFDWRHYGPDDVDYTTPIKDQGSTGCCWAFSAVAALEAKIKITAHNPNWSPDLSEQNLVCAGGIGTISGGFADAAAEYLVKDGIVSEAELPFTGSDYSPQWPLASGWPNRVYKAEALAYVAGHRYVAETTDQIKAALQSYGPLVALMNSSTDWFAPPVDLSPSTAMVATASAAPLLLANETRSASEVGANPNHGALVVGYEDDSRVSGGGYWILKNSHGVGWGDHGYGYVRYGVLEQYSDMYGFVGNAYLVPEPSAIILSGTGVAFSVIFVRRRRRRLPAALALVASLVCLLAGEAARADYPNAVMADHPLGYWRLGDPVIYGGQNFDDAANEVVGGLVGLYCFGAPSDSRQPGALVGDSDTAVLFRSNSGSSNINGLLDLPFYTQPNSPLYQIDKGAISIEMWFKPIDGPRHTRGHLFNLNQAGWTTMGDGLLDVEWFDNTIGIHQTDGAENKAARWDTFWTSTAPKLDDWNHFVLTRDAAGDTTAYLNGAAAGSMAGMRQCGTSNILVGFNYCFADAQEVIDEVAIYGCALNAAQVSAHYNANQLPLALLSVPEPNGILLLGTGLAFLLIAARWRIVAQVSRQQA